MRAQAQRATGPLFNALFPHARRVAKRVRAETGISRGHVSGLGAAVDYVREVFDHSRDCGSRSQKSISASGP
jgi:glutamyl-tRNA reductase